MENFRDSQTCMTKTGLLFLRDCGSMALNTCSACGRPICRKHSIETESDVLCPECSAPKKNLRKEPSVNTSAHRSDYYSRYDYMPYYYGHTHYYSDHDYRTFDGAESTHIDPPEEGAAFFEGDDYMES